MFKKGTKSYSIFNMKCPQCHESDLYSTPISSFQKIFTMKDACEHCGQRYELEPGFYWGSMYVAYGLSSAVMLSSVAFFYFFMKFSPDMSFVASLPLTFLLYFYIFRLARAIWINMYVSYKPTAYDAKTTTNNEKPKTDPSLPYNRKLD